MKKRVFSFLLCLCLMAAVPTVATEPDPEYTYGGWNESIWVEIPDSPAECVLSVSYTGPVSGSLQGQDFAYLVRDTADGLRIDIPGLPAGNYEVTVKTSYWDFVFQTQVQAYDRSGYAHFGYTEGVGAYNDDGTLKDNAIVLYVTEENKNTVTITSKDGTTVSGIGNILNSRGRFSNSGSKTNTNQDILHKLAADGTPLVVRILGNVTLPEGLTAHNSKDYGGTVGDNGGMAKMQGGKDITIEGIGVGACMDGWGLHFICGGGDYARGWGKSFEVRNLTFINVPEDCVGMEGERDGSNLTAPVERCWVHHCAFYGPKIANPAESDKDGGDGACDFKRGQYFTNAYCYYEGYHKTNLLGGSDSDPQYHITYHHNYWKNCESRGPLARQANIHMYNNIFEGQTSYCMNPRANAYIFSEYNLFLKCKNPVRVNKGAVKSFGDVFTDCYGDNHATVVTDRATPVDTASKYANFDTNAEWSYIPSGDYLLHADIETMEAVVKAQAGPQKGDQQAGPDQPPHSHSYEITGIRPTCTENGQIIYACQCGYCYAEPVSALGHNLTEWVTAPGGGRQWRHCLRCDFEEYEDLPPCPHEDVLWDAGTAPTCTTMGSMPSGLCMDCGTYVKVGDPIPATGHTVVTTENMASCTQGGEVISSCTDCDWTERETLEPLGHSYGPDHLCQLCGAENPDRPADPTTAPTQPATTSPAADPAPAAPKQDIILVIVAVAGVAVGVTAGLLSNRKKRN